MTMKMGVLFMVVLFATEGFAMQKIMNIYIVRIVERIIVRINERGYER